jgi:hypothetical protein
MHWYVHQNGATTGPFTTEAIEKDVKAGTLKPGATLCASGTTTWRLVSETPEFAQLAAAPPTELPLAQACTRRCMCPVLKTVLILGTLATLTYVALMFIRGH